MTLANGAWWGSSLCSAALVTLLRNLGLLPDANLIPSEPGYITMFAWAWLENQLAVACKALPLGHTAAQRVTEHMRPLLVTAVEIALQRNDEELGPILPGLELGRPYTKPSIRGFSEAEKQTLITRGTENTPTSYSNTTPCQPTVSSAWKPVARTPPSERMPP